MHYRQYLLLLSRMTFTYFVHKFRKNNSVMVAAKFEKLGGGGGRKSTHYS